LFFFKISATEFETRNCLKSTAVSHTMALNLVLEYSR
jgi:hypothetical protein